MPLLPFRGVLVIQAYRTTCRRREKRLVARQPEHSRYNAGLWFALYWSSARCERSRPLRTAGKPTMRARAGSVVSFSAAKSRHGMMLCEQYDKTQSMSSKAKPHIRSARSSFLRAKTKASFRHWSSSDNAFKCLHRSRTFLIRARASYGRCADK
jgi:hypothetical protein